MKSRVCAILLGTLISLAAGGVSQAMSELVDMTLDAQWPTSSEPGTVVSYKVTLTRAGQGCLNVVLSTQGLPDGATASFDPNPVKFTGRAVEILTSTLTIVCTNLTQIDAWPFIVTGEPTHQVVPVTNQPPAQPLIGPSGAPVLFLDPPGANSIRVRGLGATGATYQIESTTDLANPAWDPIGSSTADGNGRFTFVATQPKDSTARFYRALLPAPQP